ncbi:MAG: sulfatase [Halanaerobiaceae bacterium]
MNTTFTDQNKIECDRKANVIWVFGDQHRAQALGYRGDPHVRTPNIDNMARNGMRFDCAVAGSPWCSPFRGALLTGKYPHKNGVYKTPSPLDPSLPTIAEPFKEEGYHTAWVGKWHLDGSNTHTHYVPPEHRGGFDYWMGYENNNNQEETFIYGTENETPQRLTGYETDSLTDVMIEHLTEHVQNTDKGNGEYQPFFAALSVQPPHNPNVPPTDTDGSRKYYHNPDDIKLRPNVPEADWYKNRAKMDLAGYYGMIENLDMNIGRLRMALKELGIDRETYIIFFSDHGDCLGSHGEWGKSTPWEESIKIPFIISTVGGRYHMQTGQTDAVINHVDIAPTTLGLCGIDQPEWMVGHDYSYRCIKEGRPEYKSIDGKNKEEPDSAYLQQIPRKFHTYTVNKRWRGVLTRDGWKYVCMSGRDWLLFNLNEDPYEMANLCHNIAFQEEKERCHQLLKEWIERTGDDFSLPDISVD